VPYYAGARDLYELPDRGRLRLYGKIEDIREEVKRDLRDADLALCTSFCPDAAAASELILEYGAGIRAFYDLDTPVTLDCFKANNPVAYLPNGGLADFDMVLSYTGGQALEELKTRLGARFVAPLYGSVDPESYHPVPLREEFRSTLSYLGTYAADRQEALTRLFLEPAKVVAEGRFLIGGAQYPDSFPWGTNIFFVRHLPPSMHPAFFCSGRATLNVTRGVMAEYGFCPSGRLFEAAACGVPLLTDDWEGLDSFFVPEREILRVSSSVDVINALSLSDNELRAIANAARERTLAEHSGNCRVEQLEKICESVRSPASQAACA
jgi:spore maturation protein CgeB